jgi:hypothetical protein
VAVRGSRRHTGGDTAAQATLAGTLCGMSSSLSNLYAAAQETPRELPMPPLAFGALALAGFLVLLGVLWFFRGIGNRYVPLSELLGDDHGHQHGDQGDHHGGTQGDHQGSQH